MIVMISLRMRTLGVERAGGDINWLETHLETLEKAATTRVTATRMIIGEVEYLATGRHQGVQYTDKKMDLSHPLLLNWD